MRHTRGVETENRYFEAGMEFVLFFMFIAWNALLTNLTFGKGGSQMANHFLSFDSLMSTTLFIGFHFREGDGQSYLSRTRIIHKVGNLKYSSGNNDMNKNN